MFSLQALLLDHVIPSIFDAAVTFVLVLVLLKIFAVKNLATRFAFLFIPLLKPFIVLVENKAWVPHFPSHFFQFGLRMPDPLGLIKAPEFYTTSIASGFPSFTYNRSVFAIVAIVAIIAILLVLVGRWVQLFLFLNSFKKEERLSKSDYPHIYEILDKLVSKYKVKRPELVLTKKYQFVPFSIGCKSPIIVLSKNLIDTFPKEQLEIMLAHELAHIRRNDNLTGWIALILRDIMFFNPLIYSIYRKIEEEKEGICDNIALEKTGASAKVVANTLLDVAIFRKKIEATQKPRYPSLAKGFLYNKSALERRVNSIISHKPGNNRFRILNLALCPLKVFAFILLLLVQPYVALIYKGKLLLFLH